MGSPPHAKYPGNPVWIVLVRQLAGESLGALRAANLLLLLLTGLMLGDRLRRITTPWLGVAGLGLTVLNPALLDQTGALSEPPYTFLVVASLWVTLLAEVRDSRRWVLLGSVAAIASFLTRSVGLTVIGAFGLWYLPGAAGGLSPFTRSAPRWPSRAGSAIRGGLPRNRSAGRTGTTWRYWPRRWKGGA